MTAQSKKSISGVWLFAIVFIGIVVIMLLAHRKSLFQGRFAAPAEGVREIYSVGESLAAVSCKSKVYIWDWAETGGKPLVGSMLAEHAACLASQSALVCPSASSGLLEAYDLKTNKELKKIDLPAGFSCLDLSPSANGAFASVLLGEASAPASNKELRLAVFDLEGAQLRGIVALESGGEAATVSESAASSDGVLVAAVGVQKGAAWWVVVNAKEGNVSKCATIDGVGELSRVAFSPDGRVLYMAGSGNSIFAYDTSIYERIHTYQVAESSVDNKEQYIACMAISADGNYFAAGTEPTGDVYVWDTRSNARISVIGNATRKMSVGATMLSGIAFSPNASLIASSDSTANKNVNIWKVAPRGRL